MVVAAGGGWIKRLALPFAFVLRIALDSAAQNVAFGVARRQCRYLTGQVWGASFQ